MLRMVLDAVTRRGSGEESKPKYVVSEQLNTLARTALTGDLNRHGRLFLVDLRGLLKRIDSFNERPEARGLRMGLRVTHKFDEEILPGLLRARKEGEVPLEAVAGLSLLIGTKMVAVDWLFVKLPSYFAVHTDDIKRTSTSILNVYPVKEQRDFDSLMFNLVGRLGARQLAARLSSNIVGAHLEI